MSAAAIAASEGLMAETIRWIDAGAPPIPRPTGNSLVFDVETTNFPNFNARTYEKHVPHQLDRYESCRIVSIGWRVLGPMPELATLRAEHHIVRPSYEFESDPKALEKHGIPRERALREGEPLGEVLDRLLRDAKDCEVVVAHNAQFDVGVVLSELFRLQRYDDVVAFTSSRRAVCTLRAARVALRKVISDFKLEPLYFHFTGTPLQGAHNAGADSAACAAVYAALLRMEPPQPPPQASPLPRWKGGTAAAALPCPLRPQQLMELAVDLVFLPSNTALFAPGEGGSGSYLPPPQWQVVAVRVQ